MVRFEAPYPGNESTKNSEWHRAAPRGINSPDHLWGGYWQRFNTFLIPIFDKEQYFKTAMTIAKDSKSKEDFERKFAELNENRLKQLRSLLNNMCSDSKQSFPSRATRMTTSDACTLNCLEHFVRLLGGYILDRRADIKAAKIVVESQNYTEENPLQEGGGILVEDETETLIREISRSPSADPEYDEYLCTGDYPSEDEWSSQLPFDLDEGYKARKARLRKNHTRLKTNFESWAPRSNDNTLSSDDDVPSMQRVPSLTSNDSQDFEETNETAATKYGLRGQSSKSSNSISAKKRVRFRDDEDVSIHEPKRRKLENTHAPTPTSPTAHVPSSIKQVEDARVLRKRSRPNEGEEDNGFKRQKIGDLPRPPSPISRASSTEDESASHLAQRTSGKGARRASSGKERKQKPTSQTSCAKSPRNTPNTRSSRRAKSSTLWELDSSGKSRSI